MEQVLLTSEKLVKEIACISDNVAVEYIHAAIIEAQEIKLKTITGPALLSKVKALIADGGIDSPQNGVYKELVDRVQYFLAYQTAAELPYKTTYKIGNFGVAVASDDNLRVPSFDEVAKVKDYYQAKADFYCIEFQQYLINNSRALPELTASCCSRIRATLYSAATCGMFLGGARGKIIRR